MSRGRFPALSRPESRLKGDDSPTEHRGRTPAPLRDVGEDLFESRRQDRHIYEDSQMISTDEKKRYPKEPVGGNPGRSETGATPAGPGGHSGNSSAPSRESLHSSCRPRRLHPDAVPVRRGPQGVCAGFGFGSRPHFQERHLGMTCRIPSISSVWRAVEKRHPLGSLVRGVVRTFTNNGAFVEIAEGVDGLVDATDPGLVILGVPDIGDEVKVRVTSFDPVRYRLGLGLVSR